jgi:hypothetical protein
MAIAWRNIKEEKPADGQDCITEMKHGIIQGTYSSEDDTFSGYYWRDMEWYATHWVPVEEVI